MKNKFLKWDPSWGWDNRIYYLGSWKDDGPFYMSNSALYAEEKLCYSPPRGRLAAGSFDEEFYYGSISYDLQIQNTRHIDQELIVLDRNWNEVCSMRPSKEIRRNNIYISNLIESTTSCVAFRDPAKMPNGNLAICTGGHRWGTFGNVCEVHFSGGECHLVSESILDASMMKFKEIERVSFWDEWMFFSVNGGSSVFDPESRYIHVARAKSDGTYAYHSVVQNSWMCYGPDVSSDLRMLYWLKGVFLINEPTEQNLHYCKGLWRLSGRDFHHFYHTIMAARPIYSRRLDNLFRPGEKCGKNLAQR